MLDRFYQLNHLISKAFKKKDLQQTKLLAKEHLQLATAHKTNWNYGNAIHISNIYLGLVALEENDLVKAKEHLIKAANTPGSPQLNSFGPNMLLAKALLEKGEKVVVLKYLEHCKDFWEFLHLSAIGDWKRKIKEDEVPDFGAHLKYHTTALIL